MYAPNPVNHYPAASSVFGAYLILTKADWFGVLCLTPSVDNRPPSQYAGYTLGAHKRNPNVFNIAMGFASHVTFFNLMLMQTLFIFRWLLDLSLCIFELITSRAVCTRPD